MTDILNLALPYFGLMFIGFACGKLKRLPEAGLAWMSFFILYVALPALFFRILAKTPFEQLAQWSFIASTSLATLFSIYAAQADSLNSAPSSSPKEKIGSHSVNCKPGSLKM